MFPAADWGRRIARRPWPIVGFWLVCWLVAWPASRLAPSVLHGGGRPIAGSPSAALDDILERDFAGASFLHPVLVVLSDPRHTVHDPAYARAVQQVQARLPDLAPVESTHSFLQGQADKLTSDDGHTTVLLVGVRGRTSDQVEAAIPALRQALAGLRPTLGLPDLTTLVTSDTAFDDDIDTLSAEDSARAERRTLPFVLVCLVLAFGATGAAGLPLLVGLLSVTVTGAVVYLVGHVLSLTILIQNTASMIGLGTSIDYALVMVSRFREERSAGRAVEDAAGTALATAGQAVVGSGAMVVVGTASLLFSPLQDIRSMALGCILVVSVGVAVTLTLLPAVLSLLGDRVGQPRPRGSDDGWLRWAERLVAHPGAALAVGLVLVGLVSWPAWHLRTDLMEATWMPPQAESRQGYDALTRIGRGGLLMPIRVLLSTQDGSSMLTSSHLVALSNTVQAIQHDPRVASVQSLVSVDPRLDLDEYEANYQDPDTLKSGMLADATHAMLSHGGNRTLVYVTPANDLSNDDLLALVQRLRATPSPPDLSALVGGYGGRLLDLRDGMDRSTPPIVAAILGLTWVSLFLVFRSWLVPCKAVLMNLMSVGMAFGVLVMKFQWGWLGASPPTGRILLVLPLMLFAIVFSLSMDYEVFLVTRIQEYWLETGDNRQATVLGLARTGRMITSAATVMVLVFGCFSLADMVVVQMLGLGLAVAVAADATLIRLALVPALMQLAGRWNWVPGKRTP